MTRAVAASVVVKSAVKKPRVRSAAKATNRVKKPVSAATVVASPTSTETAAVAPKRRRAKAEVRTRIYWAVFNVELKRVAVFGFDQKVEAEKRVEKLIAQTGERHFVQKLKVVV
jgi:hypothetical protein